MRKGITALSVIGIFAALVPAGVFAQTLGNPHVFVPITPCRVVDTRQVNGGPGGPVTSVVMTLQVTGAAYSGVPAGANPCTAATGAPAGANALALNLTMANVGGPTDLRAAPQGTPPTSSLMNSSGANLANAITLPVNSVNGRIDVKAGAASFNLIVDVLGYYTYEQPTGTNNAGLEAAADPGGNAYGIFVRNREPNCTSPCNSISADSTQGMHALDILANDTGSEANVGVHGQASSTGDGTTGVEGVALGTTGATYGVHGQSMAAALDAAGVRGITHGGGVPGATGWFPCGVRGESLAERGVLGLTGGLEGVLGAYYSSGGTVKGNFGALGTQFYGVFSNGDFGGTGAKYFVEPHPVDPGREIRYISLEGPESGTYFRGSGRIVNGFATIDVPESFRLVTDARGLTAVVSPVGQMASLAVVSQDLDGIIVQGSKDVAFNYIVNGVRKAFVGFQPISENKDFVPGSPNDSLSVALPAESQRRLIATGVYNADGSVNLSTAHRMGWDAAWAERAAAAKASSEAALAAEKAKQETERASKGRQN